MRRRPHRTSAADAAGAVLDVMLEPIRHLYLQPTQQVWSIPRISIRSPSPIGAACHRRCSSSNGAPPSFSAHMLVHWLVVGECPPVAGGGDQPRGGPCCSVAVVSAVGCFFALSGRLRACSAWSMPIAHSHMAMHADCMRDPQRLGPRIPPCSRSCTAVESSQPAHAARRQAACGLVEEVCDAAGEAGAEPAIRDHARQHQRGPAVAFCDPGHQLPSRSVMYVPEPVSPRHTVIMAAASGIAGEPVSIRPKSAIPPTMDPASSIRDAGHTTQEGRPLRRCTPPRMTPSHADQVASVRGILSPGL